MLHGVTINERGGPKFEGEQEAEALEGGKLRAVVIIL